jgi:uncharacterized protein YjdB
LALAALLLSGCGDGGGSDEIAVESPLAPVPQNVGIAAFQFVLARAVPANVDTIEFYGFDQEGLLVYGPAPRNKAQEIVLENLPLFIRTFRLDYYDGDFLVGQGQVPIILSPNGRVSISDPDFVDVTASSLVVIPEMSEIGAGTSRTLSATVTLSNGDSFSVAPDATYSSSNSNIVAVDSSGRVTGVGIGTAEITVSYRGLSEIAVIEVI